MVRGIRIATIILLACVLTACHERELPGRYQSRFIPDFVEGEPFTGYWQMWEFTSDGDLYEIEGTWLKYTAGAEDPDASRGRLRGVAVLEEAPFPLISWLRFSGEALDCEGNPVGTFSLGELGPDEGGYFDTAPRADPFYDYVPGGTAFILETGEYTAETDLYAGRDPDFWNPYENFCGVGWWTD